VAGFSEYNNEPLGSIRGGISSSTQMLLTPQIDLFSGVGSLVLINVSADHKISCLMDISSSFPRGKVARA
jgi:hypothetical protein